MFKLGLIAAAAAALLVATPASAAVTFVFARTQVDPNGDISAPYGGGEEIVSGADIYDEVLDDTLLGVPRDLSAVSGLALALMLGDDLAAETSSEVAAAAQFIDPETGSVTFTGSYQATHYNPLAKSGMGNEFLFVYLFAVDTASRLTLSFVADYTVAVLLEDDGNAQTDFTQVLLAGDGSRTFDLRAGYNYQFYLEGRGRRSLNVEGPGMFTVNELSQYDFAIADIVSDPVGIPEPSTWAMLLAGFGLAGIALRRRQAASFQSPLPGSRAPA